MCRRFALAGPSSESILGKLVGPTAAHVPPRHDVGPGTQISVVRSAERTAPVGDFRLDQMHWGFVPSWKSSWSKGKQPITAHFETARDSEIFSRSFATRRALVPCSGFYEWRVLADGTREKCLISPVEGAGLAMAGVWDAWADRSKGLQDPDRWRLSIAILTSAPSEDSPIAGLRTPVMVAPRLVAEWLDSRRQPAPELVETLAAESRQIEARLTINRLEN